MGEQRRLPTLERLQQERSPQIIQIAVRLGPERLLERQPTRQPSIDLVRVHMLTEHDANVGTQSRSLPPAHVVGHQEREIRGTPVSRQTEFDVDPVVRVHIGPGDEVRAQ